MKAIKFLSHPATIIICCMLVIISGEHLGGFYLLYILLALPHAGIHALLALAAIIILLMSYHRFNRQFNYLIEPLLNVTGALLLCLSLFLFFYNDKEHYNYGTFYQTIPMISLSIFSLLVISFIIINVSKLVSVNRTIRI